MAVNAPTSQEVKRYVEKNFPDSKATFILASLSKVADFLGSAKVWYQAAILMHWQHECNGVPELLDQYIKTVNQDPRDFLLSFGNGPIPFWERKFTNQD